MNLRDVADTWASMYANSTAIRSAVSFAHIGGLVGGGGCAIAADRLTLRALRDDDRGGHAAHQLRDVHGVVLAGLAVVIVSGVLLALADLDAYLEATGFWIKMALVTALMLNGAFLVRSAARVEAGARPAESALRVASILSLVLWFVTTLAGTVLPNVL